MRKEAAPSWAVLQKMLGADSKERRSGKHNDTVYCARPSPIAEPPAPATFRRNGRAGRAAAATWSDCSAPQARRQHTRKPGSPDSCGYSIKSSSFEKGASARCGRLE